MRSFSIPFLAFLGSIAAAAGPRTIPFEIEMYLGKYPVLFVPCGFDGSVRTCQLDTGSSMTHIANDSVSSTYAPQCKEHILVEEVATGDFVLNQEIVRRPSQPGGPDIIGIRSFRGQTLEFDFAHSVVQVGAKPPAGSQLGTLIPLRDAPPFDQDWRCGDRWVESARTVAVPLAIGATEMLGIWDTGAPFTSVDERIVAKYPELFEYEDELTAEHPNGGTLVMKIYRLSKLTVGDSFGPSASYVGDEVFAFDFDWVRATLSGPERDRVQAIFGVNMARRNRWFLDLASNYWTVD